MAQERDFIYVPTGMRTMPIWGMPTGELGSFTDLERTWRHIMGPIGHQESSGIKAISGNFAMGLGSSRLLRALCCFAVAIALCAVESSSAVARKRGKHRVSHASHKSASVQKDKAAAQTPHTPTDKDDCISVSQAFYEHAQAVSRRARQKLPQEFQRVVTNLDEFCGEEEFEKARVSMDWMNTCLQTFAKDSKSASCPMDKSYFCAIDPQSDHCREQ
jgi:hypothetical protein